MPPNGADQQTRSGLEAVAAIVGGMRPAASRATRGLTTNEARVQLLSYLAFLVAVLSIVAILAFTVAKIV